MTITDKIAYEVKSIDTRCLSRSQLWQILENLPLSVEISNGHELPLKPKLERAGEPESNEEPVLLVEHHGAQLISLRPLPGKRLSNACFYGEHREVFSPSRVMDEVTGGGACCSYSFNTRNLGLPFEKEMMLDIYKLG